MGDRVVSIGDAEEEDDDDEEEEEEDDEEEEDTHEENVRGEKNYGIRYDQFRRYGQISDDNY